MKVRELISVTCDEVILYKESGEEYHDIFKGITSEIPKNILEMEVRVIGAKRKNILDIEVR